MKKMYLTVYFIEGEGFEYYSSYRAGNEGALEVLYSREYCEVEIECKEVYIDLKEYEQYITFNHDDIIMITKPLNSAVVL